MSGCPDAELDYYFADIMRVLDGNHDGLIEKTEFLDYILGDELLDNAGDFVDPSAKQEMLDRLRKNGAAAQLFKQLFEIIDTDGSGVLDENEAKQFLAGVSSESDYRRNRPDLNDLSDLASIDSNHDGSISKLEFINFVLGGIHLTEEGAFVQPEQEIAVKSYIAKLGAQLSAPVSEGRPPSSRRHHQPNASVMMAQLATRTAQAGPAASVAVVVEALVSALQLHGSILAVAEPACLALWNYVVSQCAGDLPV